MIKAVIPAAGKGTRLEPLTRSIPKEMIRVGTKPVIEHVIDGLKEGGIKDILIVTGWKKGAILDYIGSGESFGINAYYRVQEEQKGIAHAIHQAKDWIGKDEDFVVSYGDNYFKPTSIMKDVLKFHEEKKAAATLVLHPIDDPRRFGVVKINENNQVLGMIEKPTWEQAEQYKSNGVFYNIAGMIIVSSKIFEFIEKTTPGANNELQFTDSLELMRKAGYPMYGYVFKGQRYDIGTFESIKMADKLEWESNSSS
ncbi:MAG: nucleotidyltransferase family protein [Nanoarchaeota archaeon]